MSPFAPLVPHRLSGSSDERGRAQAARALRDVGAVRKAAERRFAEARAVLTSATARAYLDAQRAFAVAHCATELAEHDAVADGFGLDPALTFALLHLSILKGAYECDACTAWARPSPQGGALLVKNRDLVGAHRAHQDVFLHADPSCAVGPVLCVGTFGAPGAYSSAINASGFALADTAVGAPRHGVGWLRYFLMTRLAFTCARVEEALDFLASQRHAGGGTLVLADATGAVASVELRADGPVISRDAPAARTNHFVSEPECDVRARLSEAEARSTFGRLAHLRARLEAGDGANADAAAAMMADHGDEAREGFCRHGHGDASHTVSAAIYDTAARSLRFARGKPCEAIWEEGAMEGVS